MLDEVAAFEHGDLRHAGPHRHAHHVAADRPALALAAPAPLSASRRARVSARRRRGALRPAVGADARRWSPTPLVGRFRRRAVVRPRRARAAAAAASRRSARRRRRVSPICGLRTIALSAAVDRHRRGPRHRLGQFVGMHAAGRRRRRRVGRASLAGRSGRRFLADRRSGRRLRARGRPAPCPCGDAGRRASHAAGGVAPRSSRPSASSEAVGRRPRDRDIEEFLSHGVTRVAAVPAWCSGVLRPITAPASHVPTGSWLQDRQPPVDRRGAVRIDAFELIHWCVRSARTVERRSTAARRDRRQFGGAQRPVPTVASSASPGAAPSALGVQIERRAGRMSSVPTHPFAFASITESAGARAPPSDLLVECPPARARRLIELASVTRNGHDLLQRRRSAGQLGDRGRRPCRRAGRRRVGPAVAGDVDCRSAPVRVELDVEVLGDRTRRRSTAPGRTTLGVGARIPGCRRSATRLAAPCAPTRGRVSRWLVKRILPSLVNRRRNLTAWPRHAGSARACEQRDRHLAAGGEILARALAAAGRRDRRRHDVLEAVAGAHATVVARGPAAVFEARARRARRCQSCHRKSLCSPAEMWSHGSTSSSVRWRCTYQSSRQPLGRHRPPAHRSSRSARSTPGTCRRSRHTCSMTGPDAAVAAADMPSTIGRLAVVPLELHALGLVQRRRAPGRSCAAARRACSARTTGTACAAWARTHRRDTVTEAPRVWRRPIAAQFARQLGDAERVDVGLGRQAR